MNTGAASAASREATGGLAGPWRPGLAGLATLAITYGFARYGYGLFLSRFQSDFGGSAGALGAVTSIGYLGELLALGMVSWWAGRMSPRLPIGVGLGCAGTGMLLIAVAPNTGVLVLGVAVSGMSPGWVWTPYSDVVQDTVRPGGRAHALSMISTGTTFGVVLAGPAALFAADSRWRLVWLGAAVAAFAVLVWNVRVLPGAPTRRARSHSEFRWRELVRRRGAWPLFAAAASSGLVGAAYWSFAGVAVATANAGDERVAPALWTVIGVTGITGVFTGRLVRQLGLRVIFVSAQIVLSASLAVLWLAPAGWGFALTSAVLYGAGFMVGGTLLSVWSSTVFDDHPTRGFSVVVVFITLGAVTGPALLGLVVDHAGLGTAFAVATFLAVGTLAALPPHPRTRSEGTR
ncbi:Predicted arabinose efflux permease, MFS family [Amycolatopsis pretoriensis]|uniref:Predicted arabinose efflux permease, MFS family n=1 Tax=Amycolatopsis pretoriensis TaxID=218821 RepID=A0A1H5RFF2_9PSEU|nr:MFS transporter [Amycolatopsis pretoriensis]SEF37126.1 Predicted arabinose efflux permease, MFS family [Amycolatopsis pretoriensis]